MLRTDSATPRSPRPGWRAHSHAVPLGLFLSALATRLAFAFHEGLASWPGDDNALYHEAALGFLAGEPLPARWPALLLLIEAGAAALFGPSPTVAKLVVLLIACLIPPLTQRLATRWAGGGVGLLAGVIAVFEPYLLGASVRAMTEPPYTVLLLLTLLASPRDASSLTARRGALLGALLGLATLTRPTGLAHAAVMLAALAWVGRGRPRKVGIALGAAALTMAAALAPWVVHQRAHVGRWIVTPTGAGATLFGANCAEALRRREGWLRAGECGVLSASELARVETAGPVERDRLLLRAAIADVSSDPERWPRLVARKAASFWGWGNFGLRGSSLAQVSLLAFTSLLPLVGLGAFVLARRRHGDASLLLAAALVASTFALALVFWGGHRMRLPVEPLLVVAAAAGMHHAWHVVLARVRVVARTDTRPVPTTIRPTWARGAGPWRLRAREARTTTRRLASR